MLQRLSPRWPSLPRLKSWSEFPRGPSDDRSPSVAEGLGPFQHAQFGHRSGGQSRHEWIHDDDDDDEIEQEEIVQGYTKCSLDLGGHEDGPTPVLLAKGRRGEMGCFGGLLLSKKGTKKRKVQRTRKKGEEDLMRSGLEEKDPKKVWGTTKVYAQVFLELSMQSSIGFGYLICTLICISASQIHREFI